MLSAKRKKRAQRRDRMVSAGRGWRRIWKEEEEEYMEEEEEEG